VVVAPRVRVKSADGEVEKKAAVLKRWTGRGTGAK
jgi:hypothetical protein